MRPILYDSTETEFDTNGIGVLSDASSCVAKAALNGQCELTLKYPVTGIHFADIAQRSMILAKSDPDSELQPFRAYRITKPSASGIVTAYARHCAYDLMGIPAAPFTASSVSHALVQMKNNAVTDCPFTFYTDKSTAANMTVSAPTPIWTLLGSSKGSILDTYGGEYEFDRWKVNLWNRRGADRGVTIRYGKNLTTLEQDENCANCYTGVYPYWTNTDGTELVQLPEKTLNAPGTYNYVRILTLDLSDEWDAAPTEEQLRARAQSYMTANDIGVPTVSWKIEFVQLEQTEEYKELGRLEQVLLGDTVSVYFPDMGIEASARVVEVEYDCILERYKSVTLGSVKANLATTIAAQNKEIEKKPSLSLTERIATALAKAMTGALGGCVRLLDTDDDGMPDEVYIGDNADPDKAKKVWRGNCEGIAVSKTGYDGPYIMGATVDEGIMSWMITAAQLVAGTIMSADDGKTFFLDLDNGILRMNADELTIADKTVDAITSSAAKKAVDDQTQYSIFNKLTDNGAAQGIYLKNGKIYINLEYAQMGKLVSDYIALHGLFEIRAGDDYYNDWLGGYIGYKTGNIDGVATDGIAMLNTNESVYNIVTNSGWRVQAGGESAYLPIDGPFTVGNLRIRGDIIRDNALNYTYDAGTNRLILDAVQPASSYSIKVVWSPHNGSGLYRSMMVGILSTPTGYQNGVVGMYCKFDLIAGYAGIAAARPTVSVTWEDGSDFTSYIESGAAISLPITNDNTGETLLDVEISKIL